MQWWYQYSFHLCFRSTILAYLWQRVHFFHFTRLYSVFSSIALHYISNHISLSICARKYISNPIWKHYKIRINSFQIQTHYNFPLLSKVSLLRLFLSIVWHKKSINGVEKARKIFISTLELVWKNVHAVHCSVLFKHVMVRIMLDSKYIK